MRRSAWSPTRDPSSPLLDFVSSEWLIWQGWQGVTHKDQESSIVMCWTGSCYSPLTWGFRCGLESQGSLASSSLSDMGFWHPETSGQLSVVMIVSSHPGQLNVWLSKQRAATRKAAQKKGSGDFTESWACEDQRGPGGSEYLHSCGRHPGRSLVTLFRTCLLNESVWPNKGLPLNSLPSVVISFATCLTDRYSSFSWMLLEMWYSLPHGVRHGNFHSCIC